MKKGISILFHLTSYMMVSPVYQQNPSSLPLVLLEDIIIIDRNNFHLSGMTIDMAGNCYIVSDEHEYIYQLVLEGNDRGRVNKIKELEAQKEMEAIVSIDTTFLVGVEENANQVVSFRPTDTLVTTGQLSSGSWDNEGIEGLALDTDKKVLYIAKEMYPSVLYRYQIGSSGDPKKIEIQGINETEDVSDLYFEGGYLYALMRKAREIRKIDLTQKKVVSIFRYFDFVAKDRGKKIKSLYYQKSSEQKKGYGLAESLAITKDWIYVGFDNNGQSLLRWAKRKYKDFDSETVGSKPIIMKFRRPKF